MNISAHSVKRSISMMTLSIAWLAIVILWSESRVSYAAKCDTTLSCGSNMYCSSYGTCQPGCIGDFNCSGGDLCVRERVTDIAGTCTTQMGCQFSAECKMDEQKCNMDLQKCVAGCDNTSCSAGKRCSNDKCIPANQDECQGDGDCQSTQFCNTMINPHRCQELAKPCSRPEDCPGETCNTRLRVCQSTWGVIDVGQPKLFCVSTVPELIAAITEANKTHAQDTVVLQSGTYTLGIVDNDSDDDGSNGLPNIINPLIITAGDCGAPGNGRATIQRADGAPSFRILHVASGGTLTLENVTIMGGLSDLGSVGGGGILNKGELIITNSTITGNSTDTADACFGGGGILNFGNTTITNSTIAGNKSEGVSDGGGGILNLNGDLTITDSTIAGNQADNTFLGGGGILNETASATCGSTSSGTRKGTATITSSTIARNRAVTTGVGGGGILNEGTGSVTIKNTIVAQNVGAGGFLEPNTSDCGNSGEGAIVSAGHNMSNGISCGFGNGVGVDPLLDIVGPFGLQDNGGPTETIALLPGSPAIDAIPPAECTDTTDQRGFSRPFGAACDIGAFEFVP